MSVLDSCSTTSEEDFDQLSSEDDSPQLFHINPFEYLVNFKPTKPLGKILYRSKELLRRIREVEICKFDNKFEGKFCRLFKALNDLEDLHDIILNVLFDKPNLDSGKEPKLTIPNKESICTHILSDFLDFVLNYITKTYEIITDVGENGLSQEDCEQVQMLTPKFETLVSLLPYAINYAQDDIFALRQKDFGFKELKDIVKVKRLGEAEQLRKSYGVFLSLVYLGNSVTIHEQKYSSCVMKKLSTAFFGSYYLVRPDQAKRLTELFISDPAVYIFNLWNTLDEPLMRPFFSMILPSININDEIKVERNYPEISLSVVDNATKKNIWADPNIRIFKDSDYNLKNKSTLPLGMRVVSPVELIPGAQQFDELIIHIHGGGWVSGSSFSNQIITRKWANKLEKPVFGFDYSHAPKHQYPKGLNDCWQSYNWLVENASKFGINPKKIILIGDSAGGNLVLTLTLLLIKEKRTLPTGIYLPYPALDINPHRYTPSLKGSFEDPILAYSYLHILMAAYLDNPERGTVDPLVSPVLINDEHLKLYPPIKITVGSDDPLHDDSWRFVEKLRRLGNKVSMTVYSDMPHGYLSYDMPSGMPEAVECIQDSVDDLKELLFC